MIWDEMPHWARCIHLMKALRGNWSGGRDNTNLAMLYEELDAATSEALADPNWLSAVRANADYFDGHFRDGRVFRDGQRFMPAKDAAVFGIQSTPGDPAGLTSVSGNIAAAMGGEVAKQGDWYGNYEETPVAGVASTPEPHKQCPSKDCLSHDQ